MECLPTALAERLENGGTLGIFRAVVISEDFDLRNHVLVDIGNLRAHIAGIDQIRAVQHESHRPVWLRPIRRERAHRPVVRSHNLVVEAPTLRQAVREGHSRHDFQQLTCVAAY